MCKLLCTFIAMKHQVLIKILFHKHICVYSYWQKNKYTCFRKTPEKMKTKLHKTTEIHIVTHAGPVCIIKNDFSGYWKCNFIANPSSQATRNTFIRTHSQKSYFAQAKKSFKAKSDFARSHSNWFGTEGEKNSETFCGALT